MKAMIDIENGRYWDRPWSLISGCTPCSPGCDHCWSESMTRRLDGKRDTGLFLMNEDTGKFNGHIITHPERLEIPLKRKKPTVYAVWNDLFHEAVPDQLIYGATRVMKARSWHTFLLLTKRPEKMRRLSNLYDELPNVWSGLTVCNQQEADAKIPIFLQVPGKKFLSLEPLLGPINFRWMKWISRTESTGHLDILKDISCVILDGETGPGARPLHPDWVRSVRDQCAATGVPFFFKGWGEWEIASYENGHYGSCMPDDGKKYVWVGKNGKIFFPSAPADHDCWAMAKSGRKKAGRILDSRTHNDLPWGQERRPKHGIPAKIENEG